MEQFIINITSQYRYLLDHGASVSAVNNDGELAIDISESDEMEELLQKEIDNQVNVHLTGFPTDMYPPRAFSYNRKILKPQHVITRFIITGCQL